MAPDAPELDDLLARPRWHQEAACKSVGVRTYFSNDPATEEIARAICAGCEVRQECHDTAMAYPGLEGVRARFTAKDRRSMRRGRAVA